MRRPQAAGSRKRKKLLATVAVVGAAALAAGAALWLSSGRPIGTVNGTPFYAQELVMYGERFRAAVSSEFCQTYGLPGTGADFWSEEYDGTLPVDVLLDRAVQELTRDKVIQQECVARGIAAPLDFRQLEKALALENQDRAAAISSGGAVYGTQQYTLEQYSDYQMTLSTDELKERLLEELAPTRSQLQEAFDSLDETFRRKDFTADGYRFSWDGGPGVDEGLALIQGALLDGAQPLELPSRLADQLAGLSAETFSLDTAARSKDDLEGDLLTGLLFSAAPGDCVGDRSSGECTVYFVTEKEGGGYYTLDEAPGLAENKFVNDAFDALVEERTQQAVVEVDQNRARAILLDALQ